MSGFEELEPAKLYEGDIAPRELDFERCAVVRGAEQYGLRLERDACFTVFQDLIRYIPCLIGFVADIDQTRPLGGCTFRPKVFRESLVREVDDRIRRRKDGLS